MHLSLSMRPALILETRQEQRLDQLLEQKLDITLELCMKLEDPFEFARRLFEESQKVNVPIDIGRYKIAVRAAIVSERDLTTLFEAEKFAGIIARLGESYQFFNRELRSPDDFRTLMPKLMAFHCLASIKVPDYGDETGIVPQYQAIALELAYAKTLMKIGKYAAYEKWRQTVERTDFFRRPDWPEIVAMTFDRFKDLSESFHKNAQEAKFLVTTRGRRHHRDEVYRSTSRVRKRLTR